MGRNGARFFRDYGCLEIVECWEDFVPDGQQTDFRRAVEPPFDAKRLIPGCFAPILAMGRDR